MSRVVEQIDTVLAEDLPPGWSLATIEDLVGVDGVFVDGDWVESKDQDPTGHVRLIQLADIGDGEYRNKSDRFLTNEKALELGCTFLMRGDVLIARMPDPLGRACIFPGDPKKSVTVVDIAIVRSGNGEFNHRWLMYFINAPVFRTTVASLQSGSTRKRISRGNLARLALPVPPREQQDSIVAEIEKQFSRLDEAVANLKRVKANLKRYKAAVLKAAVEGKLTEDWRKQHPGIEPASKLLERILAERRAKWSGKAKCKEPVSADTSKLPALPERWAWCITDALFSYVTSGSRGWAQHYSVEGPLFLRIGNLDHDSIRLDLRDIQRVKPPEETEGTRTKVEEGDILVSITADVGMIAVAPPSLGEAYINQHVALARPVSGICREYLAWYLAARDGGQKEFRRLQRGATKVGLGLDDIRAVPVPLPSLAEQQQIVAEVERRLSVLEELDVAVQANLTRADRLRQSVLAQAFSGGLIRVQ